MENIGIVPLVIRNFLDLEDKISVNQLKILDVIFSKLNTHELVSSNVIWDGIIEDGLKLVKKDKEYDDDTIDIETLTNLLTYIDQKLNEHAEEPDKIIFYKALINLARNANYLTAKEQITLNFLFDKLEFYNKEIITSNTDTEKFAIKMKKKATN